MDRLSPLSYDSGFDSVSSPASPMKHTGAMRFGASPMPAVLPSSFSASLPDSTTSSTSPDDISVEQLDTPQQSISYEEITKPEQSKECEAAKETSSEPSEILSSESVPCVPTASSSASNCSEDAAVKVPIASGECYLGPSTSLFEPLVVDTNVGDVTLPQVKAKKILLEKESKSARRLPFSCKWIDCEKGFPTFNDMYDHVVEIHIEAVKDDASEADIEVVCCGWEDCKLSMSRGDRTKKFTWLLGHYRSRHAKQAQPFKCLLENCGTRFGSTARLEEHMRAQHINQPKKPKAPPAPKPITWYGWRTRRYWPRVPPGGGVPLWSPYYDFQILRRVCEAEKANFQLTRVNRKRPGTGAQHRKSYAFAGTEWVPSKRVRRAEQTTNETVSEVQNTTDENDRVIAMDEPVDLELTPDTTTLDDLFPGWNYAETKRIREEKEEEERVREWKRERDEREYRRWVLEQQQEEDEEAAVS